MDLPMSAVHFLMSETRQCCGIVWGGVCVCVWVCGVLLINSISMQLRKIMKPMSELDRHALNWLALCGRLQLLQW